MWISTSPKNSNALLGDQMNSETTFNLLSLSFNQQSLTFKKVKIKTWKKVI